MEEVQDVESSTPERRQISLLCDLSDDLLVEVLVRLPCKFVIRFKSVCKHWISLISSPKFVQCFLDHHRVLTSSLTLSSSKMKKQVQKPWRFIVLDPPYDKHDKQEVSFLAGFGWCDDENNVWPLFKPNLPFLPRANQPGKGLCVVGSFNDLILCSMGVSFQSVYYICNPLTMQFTTLPPPPRVHFRVSLGFICEPFHPNNEENSIDDNHALKFDYRCRVVRIAETHGTVDFPLPLELEIFSSETGLWTTHTLSLSCDAQGIKWVGPDIKVVALQNGEMVLWVKTSHMVKIDPFSNQNEVIVGHLLHLPENFHEEAFIATSNVIASQGRLLLLRIPTITGSYGSLPSLKVWELNDDNNNHSEWRLIHQVLFSEMKATPSPTGSGYSAEDFEWIFFTKANPYSKKHRKTWVGNFVKSLVETSASTSRYDPYWEFHVVNCVGFDLTRANVMYLHLRPPKPALTALASYNMKTRAIKLTPKRMMPPHLRSNPYLASHIVPFVLQPWPTPLPKIGIAPSLRHNGQILMQGNKVLDKRVIE